MDHAGRKILLMRPKWSEGVLTRPSCATLLKCSSSKGGTVKSPMMAISCFPCASFPLHLYTMWSGLHGGYIFVGGIVYPTSRIYSLVHLLQVRFPTFHTSVQSLIALFSGHPSLKLKSPAIILISMALLRASTSLSWAMRCGQLLRLSRCVQLTDNLKVLLVPSWANSTTAMRSHLPMPDTSYSFLQKRQGYLERMSVSYQCILVTGMKQSSPSNCLADWCSRLRKVLLTSCRQIKSAFESASILMMHSYLFWELWSSNQTLQVSSVIDYGFRNTLDLMLLLIRWVFDLRPYPGASYFSLIKFCWQASPGEVERVFVLCGTIVRAQFLRFLVCRFPIQLISIKISECNCTSEGYLGDQSEMIRGGPDYKVMKDLAEMVLLVVGNCEIANDSNLVPSLFLQFAVFPVDDVVKSYCRTALVRWHGKSLFFHLLVRTLAEVSLACLPDVCVNFNCFVLGAAIREVEIACNNAEVHDLIECLYFFQLLHSGPMGLRTLQMHAIHCHFESIFRSLLEKLHYSCQITSPHLRIHKRFLIEATGIARKDESVVPIHLEGRHIVAF